MKNYYFKIILLTIISTNTYALEEANIKPFMVKAINNTTAILQDKKRSLKEKSKDIFLFLDKAFDYNLMSKISLGKNYKKLSPDEKKRFRVTLEHKMKHSYVEKLKLYKNEHTKIGDLIKVKKNRKKLFTNLIGVNSDISINYKFYKNKRDNKWYIYDIELYGVSLMKSYRKQFSTFLKSNSIDNLIKNL